MVYTFPLLPCLTYSVHFGGFVTQFLIEKMGMMGSLPPPYGKFELISSCFLGRSLYIISVSD